VIGRFVISNAGRDRGRIHIILACDGEYFLIVDGRTRKVDKPKKKKQKHTVMLEFRSAEIETLTQSGVLTNKKAHAAVKEVASVMRLQL